MLPRAPRAGGLVTCCLYLASLSLSPLSLSPLFLSPLFLSPLSFTPLSPSPPSLSPLSLSLSRSLALSLSLFLPLSLSLSRSHALSPRRTGGPNRRAPHEAAFSQKALCGGIPGDGFGIWARFCSHFEGKSRQKMTNLQELTFEIPPRRALRGHTESVLVVDATSMFDGARPRAGSRVRRGRQWVPSAQSSNRS